MTKSVLLSLACDLLHANRPRWRNWSDLFATCSNFCSSARSTLNRAAWFAAQNNQFEHRTSSSSGTLHRVPPFKPACTVWVCRRRNPGTRNRTRTPTPLVWVHRRHRRALSMVLKHSPGHWSFGKAWTDFLTGRLSFKNNSKNIFILHDHQSFYLIFVWGYSGLWISKFPEKGIPNKKQIHKMEELLTKSK